MEKADCEIMEVVELVLSLLRMPKNNSFIPIPCKYINSKNSRRYYKRNTNSRSCTRPSSISHFSTIQSNPHYLAYLCCTPCQNIHRCFSRLAASEVVLPWSGSSCSMVRNWSVAVKTTVFN